MRTLLVMTLLASSAVWFPGCKPDPSDKVEDKIEGAGGIGNLGGMGGAGPDISPDDVDLPGEAANAADRGSSTTAATQAKATTELFVHEDPTLDTAKTAAQNAQAVADQVKASVSACASAAVTHTSGDVAVAVSFGSDCSIQGVTFSGDVSASVSTAGGGVTVAFTFTNLVVNGNTLNGTASEATKDGTTFTSNIALTVGAAKVTYKGALKLDAGLTSVTIDGTGTYQNGSGPSSAFTSTGVHHVFSACYADAGTLTFTQPTTTKTGKTVNLQNSVTFSSTTPSTGQASVKIGSAAATTVTLPPYGSCPHP
jgi:hypothetical protein